jgi:lipoate-protein ligase A
MPSICTFKVPNGKLLRVAVEFEGDTVRELKISGDFFLHPETGIELLELAARGKKLNELENAFENTLKKNKLLPLGFDAASLAQAIKMAKGD